MAEIRMKDPVMKKVRTVGSKSTGAVRCEVLVPNEPSIVTDEPVERGGTGTAASPLMHFTASLATCQTVQIIKVAEAMRFKHGVIDIKASTTTDHVAAVEGEQKVMRLCAAEMLISIETNEPEKKIERLKLLSEDRCPVGQLFNDAGYPPKLIWTILPLNE
jgi:uncharacterized OsmC-like protein